MWVKGDVIKGELIFSNLVAIEFFSDLFMFLMSLVDNELSMKFGKVHLKDCKK
jgi:hypothetical protein